MSKKIKANKSRLTDSNASLDTLHQTYEKKVKNIIKSYSKEEADEKNNEKKYNENYYQVALIEAEKLWYHLQTILATNSAEYMRLRDEEKINMFKNDFDKFYNEFPIVSRYLICHGQYKRKAFEKYLTKCKNTILDNDKRMQDKKYMQDQWIQRQSDYVRYLWEEYQPHKKNKKESNNIWQQAYSSLTKEFSDFQNMYENTEQKIKKNDIKYKNELLKELIHRTNTSNQKISVDDAKELLSILKEKQIKQRKKKVINEIREVVPYIRASCVGMGTNILLQKQYDEELKEQEIRKKIKKTI
jgi:hypothetical protein